jgi:spermidine synthase
VAHRYFALPRECDRLSIVIGDGARLIGQQREAEDLMLIDAYDGRSLAASLATEAFFQAARAALSPAGVLAMNLWSSDRAFDHNVRIIERAFDGRCLCLPAERPGNVIVFAFAAVPRRLHWAELRSHAAVLQERFGLEFPRFVEGLRTMNACNTLGLRLEAMPS